MAVAVDAVGTAQTTNPGTTLSVPITIGVGANAIVLGFTGFTDTVGVTVSGAGATWAVVSGTDGAGTTGTVIWGGSTPTSGAQTVSVSWTNSQNAIANAITFTGSNGTFNNGTFGGGASPFSLTVTSTNGDMTTTCFEQTSTTTGPTTNQTSRWQAGIGAVGGSAGDTGPGTGTTTHIWTQAGSSVFGSGCNVVKAAAAAAVQHVRALLGVGS